MKITIPMTPKPQSRPRFADVERYVQTYEDSTMKTYKQQVKTYLRRAKPKLIEKGQSWHT